MTTTCQAIYASARSFSPDRPKVIPDPYDILSRIRADQQALFTSIASETRDFYQTTATIASSGGSSARIVDLSSLVAQPVERILKVLLADGTEVSQVDMLDVEAEFAPRYFVRGRTLIEVSNDWSAVPGVLNVTLVYVYGMADLDPAGALTQLVSVPDTWADLLVLPLAIYLDPAQTDRLEKLLSAKQAAFVSYLRNYSGVESRRFNIPAKGDKK